MNTSIRTSWADGGIYMDRYDTEAALRNALNMHLAEASALGFVIYKDGDVYNIVDGSGCLVVRYELQTSPRRMPAEPSL